MRISVCVAATRPDTVGATARSIAAQTHGDWELIVIVQGGAAPAVAEAVEREVPRSRARVLPQDGKGLSRARNAAVRAASGDVIAMTDDDCEAAPDWLAVLVDRFASLPQAGIVGGTVVAPPARVRGPGNCPSCHPGEVLYEPGALPDGAPPGFHWIGANFAFRRSTAELVGDFDELLGDPRGAEDLATMRRLMMADWIERRRPVALPAGIRRYHHFAAGYRECLQRFHVDDRGLLHRRSQQPAPQGADR